MKRRSLVLLLGAALPLARAAGLGPSDRGYVDSVRIDSTTGTATLVLLIDHPLEDGLTKSQVRSKILAYRQWVLVEGKLSKHFPEAKLERGVNLVLLHPQPKNALGASVLEQLLGYAKELGFRASAQALPVQK